MKRILTALLAALLLVGAVSGCKTQATPPAGGTTGASTGDSESVTTGEGASEAPKVTIAKEGKTDYQIVVAREATADSDIAAALTSLSKAFRQYLAVDPVQMSDAVYAGKSDAPLILVGNTKVRDNSDLNAELRIGEYFVGMCDDQIVIYAKTNDMIARAITYFTNMVVIAEGKKGTDVLELAADFAFTKRGEFAMESILLNGTELADCSMVVSATDPVASSLANELNYKLVQKYGYTLAVTDSASGGNALRVVKSAAVQGYTIRTDASGITVTVDGMTSADAALNAFFDRFLKGATSGKVCTLTNGVEVSGTAAEAAQDADALVKSGDARIIFYNMNGHSNNANSEARRDIQLGFLADYAADVLCFQEFHRRSYINGFSAGLEAMGYAIVNVNTNGVNNYTPIYYRADRYEVKDSGYRLYTGYNDENSKGLTWALLRDKTTGKQLVAISTHFWWKGYDAADKADFATHNATRVSNANEMLETVRAIQAKYGASTPIVFGGDLNSLYHSDPVNTILAESGVSLAWNVAEKKNNSGGHHGYATFNEEYRVFTAWGSPSASQTYNGTWSIDHVFVSGQVTVKRFHTLLDRYALIVSDHCPEIVDIAF